MDSEDDVSHKSDARKPQKSAKKRARSSPKVESDKDSENSEERDEGQYQNEENKKQIKPKPFLKRKTAKVKFQKLNWNKVQSKTDCWTKNTARSENRDKSAQRLPKKAQKEKNDSAVEKIKGKNRSFRNIKSRIDTGIRKQDNKFGSDYSRDSFEYPGQYNIGEYADEESESFLNQHNYPQNKNHPAVDVRRYHLNQPGNFKNTSNPEYDDLSSDEEDLDQPQEEYNYGNMSKMRNKPNQMYNPYDDSQDDDAQIGKYLNN